MGHAIHFLSRLERLGLQETELALSLYRDTKLLREVISMAKLPEAHERVAIAMRAEANGPHLVVTRDGDFVTCLGEGMGARDLPIISREQLDEFSGRLESLRERIKIAEGLVQPGKRTITLVDRLREAGHLLSREEFLAISAFSAVYVPNFLSWMLKDSMKLLSRGVGLIPHANASLRSTPVREKLLQLWKELWEAAHVTALCTENAGIFWKVLSPHGDMTGFSACSMRLDFRPLGLRMVRLMAGMGEGLLPVYARKVPEGYWWKQLEATAGIFSIGMRNESARASARAELARIPEVVTDQLDTLANDPAGLQELVGLMLRMLDNPDSALDLHAEKARENWLEWTRKLPPGSPLRLPDASSEKARVFAALAGFNGAGPVVHEPERFIVSAGAAARLNPEDLYWPASELSEVREVLDEDWALEQTVKHLKHLRPLLDNPNPDRVEKKARPNDRCPCGSGKKFKRCCRGKAA
jgi:hypothetical protein